MMKKTRIILFALSALLLSGCGASRKSVVNMPDAKKETLVSQLCQAPVATELSADVKYRLSGTSMSGQLRMRRGRCIQLSFGLLGVELGRIEMFPDHVMIMDRTGGRYVECHYADLPLRNQLELDYNSLEALFWDRMFSPGRETVADISSAMTPAEYNRDGSAEFTDMEWGNVFKTDSKGHLTEFSKSGQGWNFIFGYRDFVELEKGFEYPRKLKLDLNVLDARLANLSIEADLSSLTTSHGSWKDSTEPTRRMKSVSLDKILEVFEGLF